VGWMIRHLDLSCDKPTDTRSGLNCFGLKPTLPTAQRPGDEERSRLYKYRRRYPLLVFCCLSEAPPSSVVKRHLTAQTVVPLDCHVAAMFQRWCERIQLNERVYGDYQSCTGSLGSSCSVSMNCLFQTKLNGTEILALRNAPNHTCDSWVLKLRLLALAMVY
jgi:hypothetical protein